MYIYHFEELPSASDTQTFKLNSKFVNTETRRTSVSFVFDWCHLIFLFVKNIDQKTYLKSSVTSF